MKNYVIVGVLLLVGVGLFSFLMTGSATPNESEVAAVDASGTDDVVASVDAIAVVNGEEISNVEFDAQQAQVLSAQGVEVATLDNETLSTVQNQVLDSMISQKLLQQAAASADIEVPAADIDAQLEMIKGQFDDEVVYQAALEGQGLTEEELKAQLAIDLSVEPYLEQTLSLSSITVTEEEISQTYQELATQQDLPALEQVETEIEQLVRQQKQQPLIDQLLAELREVAQIEVFI